VGELRSERAPLGVGDLGQSFELHDGLYVALAERLGVPLLTADSTPAAANGPRCPIELV
jgi:predicted nucleic acid-binding protein